VIKSSTQLNIEKNIVYAN